MIGSLLYVHAAHMREAGQVPGHWQCLVFGKEIENPKSDDVDRM